MARSAARFVEKYVWRISEKSAFESTLRARPGVSGPPKLIWLRGCGFPTGIGVIRKLAIGIAENSPMIAPYFSGSSEEFAGRFRLGQLPSE
jgi:hypothetical protein